MLNAIHLVLAVLFLCAFISLLASITSIFANRMEEHMRRLEFSVLCAGFGLIFSLGCLFYSILTIFM